MSVSMWKSSNACILEINQGHGLACVSIIDSPRGGLGDPKAEYIEAAFTKMRALKDAINDMMTDLTEFKERAAATDITQKEIIQE